MTNDLKSYISKETQINKLLSLKNKSNLLYTSGMHSKDKRVKICNYLLNRLSPEHNFALFNKHALAKKFGCSQMTVSRAINAMKKSNHINVHGNIIRLIIQKGDVEYDKK